MSIKKPHKKCDKLLSLSDFLSLKQDLNLDALKHADSNENELTDSANFTGGSQCLSKMHTEKILQHRNRRNENVEIVQVMCITWGNLIFIHVYICVTSTDATEPSHWRPKS
jgi:hypothetical protein